MLFLLTIADVDLIYSADNAGVVFLPRGSITDQASVVADLAGWSATLPLSAQAAIKQELDAATAVNTSKTRPLRTLYLSLTDRCNLNCKYCICHNSFGVHKAGDMTEATLLQAIQTFTQLSEPGAEREVVLYGGEPALRQDLVALAYQQCRQAESAAAVALIPARFILCTNGTAINQTFCDFLATTDIYPAVSIDGDQVLHDEYRPFFSGKGSYAAALAGLKLLQQNGIKAGVTMTLGAYNVATLPALVAHAAQHYQPQTLAINMLLDYDNQETKNSYCAAPHEAKVALWEAFLTARDCGIYIVKHVMDNRVKPLVEKSPRLWGCTGTGARMAVKSNGAVVSCMALANTAKQGNLAQITTSQDFVDDYMTDYGPFVCDKCQSCLARATCGGMCPAAIKQQDLTYDDNFCQSSIFFTENLLKLLFTLNSAEILAGIEQQGYFIPQLAQRRKIYGKIAVGGEIRDFQHSPN